MVGKKESAVVKSGVVRQCMFFCYLVTVPLGKLTHLSCLFSLLFLGKLNGVTSCGLDQWSHRTLRLAMKPTYLTLAVSSTQPATRASSMTFLNAVSSYAFAAEVLLTFAVACSEVHIPVRKESILSGQSRCVAYCTSTFASLVQISGSVEQLI